LLSSKGGGGRTLQENNTSMDPRHCSEVLDPFASLEDLAIVLDVDFADVVDAFGAALRGRDCIFLLFG
jgi:hypothetical protein